MLGAIKDAVLLIVDVFTSLFDFFIYFFVNINNFLSGVIELTLNIGTWLDYMPIFLLSSISILVIAQLLLRILGR